MSSYAIGGSVGVSERPVVMKLAVDDFADASWSMYKGEGMSRNKELAETVEYVREAGRCGVSTGDAEWCIFDVISDWKKVEFSLEWIWRLSKDLGDLEMNLAKVG